jgi:hypothetical protein
MRAIIKVGLALVLGAVAGSSLPYTLRAQDTSRGAEDCVKYDPSGLKVTDRGIQGWALTTGSQSLAILDNQRDAEAALALAKKHSAQCFIGRGNKRDHPWSYTIQYWK